ncbi:MAG: hypothetical protein JXA21_21505, partial [Anaerolineae bacterium]|nr:hypothetical protein [Anaerolineae bacterium]
MESRIDRRADEIIAGLPVYPDAEQIYVYRKDAGIFPWLFWGDGIYPPTYDVFYGLKEEIPSEAFDAYMRTAFSDAGWPRVYVVQLDGYNFNKDGVCIPYLTFGTSDEHELAEY